MSRLPRCYSCICADGITIKCPYYKDDIPNDIFNESKECEHFVQQKEDDNADSDLPIAKGR